ncbi:MAG TPA: HAMP domain-containing protein, partial [Candidatus Marinimicrobia bacterium]|nr:HAMP domain-containing protein [Candidatus Neomarinimicrobiota bacterium]
CIAFTVYDRNTFKENYKKNLSTLANIIGTNNVTALEFDDPDTAKEVLNTLKANTNIVVAALYDAAAMGENAYAIPTLFTEYTSEAALDQNEGAPRRAGSVRQEYTSDNKYLVIVQEIQGDDNAILGSILIKAHTKEIGKRITNIFGLSAVILLVSAVVALLIAAYFQGMISRPILHLVDIMHGVTENEDFSLRAEKEDDSELGKLVDGFNVMVAHTDNIIQKIQNAVLDLDNTSTDIVQASQNQASGAAQQSATVSQTVAAVEESAKTSAQISENANEVAELAQSSLDTVQTGQVTVQQVVQAMEIILTSTTESVERISQLEDKAEEITDVLGQIDEIARRTDLIALNANIEAVNAGDQGRGFTVVANEVKRLAEQTITASGQIKNLTKEITSSIGDSVTASQQSTDQVTEGVRLAEETGGHLDKILEMVQKTAEAAVLIDRSTKQQQSASEQVVSAMRDVDGVSKESEADAQKTLTTSEELVQIGQTLQSMLKVQGNGGNLAQPS